ncbi:MAG: sensor histidine kinase [Pseudomonadota bacterium]
MTKAILVATGLFSGLLIVLAVLTELNVFGKQLIWINAYWLVCALGAVVISLMGMSSRRGLARRISRLIAIGFGVYLMGQITWITQQLMGWAVVPGPSDVFFITAPLPAVWAAWLGIQRQGSPAALITVRLDTLTMFLSISAAALAISGPYMAGFTTIEALTLLAYPVMYFGLVGAIVVSLLAVPQRPRFEGIWLYLLAVFVFGVALLIWTARAFGGKPPVGTWVDYTFAVSLLGGLGAATWRSDRSRRKPPSRVSLQTWSEVLPVSAVLVAVVVVLTVSLSTDVSQVTWLVTVVLMLVNGLRQVLRIRAQRRSQQSLRLLAVDLSNTEERERRHVATYLHDHIGQVLAVLKMKVAGLQSVPKDNVEEINQLLDQTIADTRATTFELSPPMLYDLGLAKTLESLSRQLSRSHAIPILLLEDDKAKPLSDEVAPLVYRSVRELLMNAIKYAAASRIEVALSRSGPMMRVTVQDDGIGFDKSKVLAMPTHGFGLFSIRERAYAIGGEFNVQTRPGNGTRANLTIPLDTESVR